MSQTELSSIMRTRLYVSGAAITALLALTALFTGHIESAIIALIFSTLLAINSFFQKHNLLQKNSSGALIHNPLTHITMFFLAGATLFSIINSEYSVLPWSYIFPTLLFFFYPLKIAAISVTVYTLCFITFLTMFHIGPIKAELLINYLLCLTLTGGFVYLREIKERQLNPLRRTDNLTLASTKEHLNNDLEKEIQRSEREGTDLTIMALTIDEQGFNQVDLADHDMLLNKLGHTLHENLRAFESYYRWKDHEFLILFPYTNTKDAMKTAEKLRIRVKESLSEGQHSITVSIGTASLNVGDDTASMLEKSLAALHQAQKNGSNRTQSYIEGK